MAYWSPILVSSTDIRGLELRVWGDLKTLFQMAIDLHDWLPGNVLDSKHAIATDSVEDGEVRDLREEATCIAKREASPAGVRHPGEQVAGPGERDVLDRGQ